MANPASKKVIYAALLGNALIAIYKIRGELLYGKLGDAE